MLEDFGFILFMIKTVAICALIYIGIRLIFGRLGRLGKSLGEERKRMESIYECYTNEALIDVLNNNANEHSLNILSALTVAETRLSDSEEIRKSVDSLQRAKDKLVRLRAKSIMDNYCSGSGICER